MTRPILLLAAAAAVMGALLAVNAFTPAPAPHSSCPDTGDPLGKPLASTAVARIVGTFNSSTIETCWPWTSIATK